MHEFIDVATGQKLHLLSLHGDFSEWVTLSDTGKLLPITIPNGKKNHNDTFEWGNLDIPN